MASKIKAVAEIELKTDRFTQPAKQAKTALSQLGKEGQQSFSNIAKTANTTKQSITTLGTQSKQSMNQIGQSANTANQSITTLGSRSQQSMSIITNSVNKSITSIGRISIAAGTAGTSIAVLGSTAQRSMGTIVNTTSQAINSTGRLTTAVATATTSLATLSTTGTRSMTHLSAVTSRSAMSMSSSMNRASASMNQFNMATKQATASSGIMILGFATLFTSMGTTFTGMSNLNKAQLKLDKSNQKVLKSNVGLKRANDLLSSTQLAVERFTLSIAKAERDGTTNTDAYTISKKNLTLQQQKLNTAKEDYAVKLKDIKIAENDAAQAAEDLSDTHINMAISISNTALMSGFLAATMLPKSTKAFVVNKLAVVANSRAFTSLIFSMKKFRIATSLTRVSAIGLTTSVSLLKFSLKGLALGIKGVFVAMGPIGWAIIGLTVAFEIWHSNVFGVQEAVFGLWEKLKELLPILQLVETAVRTIFPPEAEESVESLDESIQEITVTADDFAESMDGAGNSMASIPSSANAATASLTGLSSNFSQTTNAIIAFQSQLSGKGIKDLETRATALTTLFQSVKADGIDTLSPAFKLAKKEILPELTEIALGLNEAFGADKANEYINNLDKIGVLGANSFDKIRKSIEKVNGEIEETKKNFDSLVSDQEDNPFFGKSGIFKTITSPTEKMRIDPAMLLALIKAENSGLLASGTSGLFKAIANITPSTQTRISIGSLGHSLLQQARLLGGSLGISGTGSRNRKTQQLAAVRERVQSQQQQASELNAFFGIGIFRVQSFSAHRGRTSLTPTKRGRQILSALGLGVNDAQLLKDANVNLGDFFGTDISYPVFGSTSRVRIIHNGRRVTLRSFDVRVGSRTVTSGATGEARLAAISLAVVAARRILAERVHAAQFTFDTTELLTNRLGLTDTEFFDLTKNQTQLEKLLLSASTQSNISTEQVQDFLSTATGQNDLANKIGWAQREELLSTLV